MELPNPALAGLQSQVRRGEPLSQTTTETLRGAFNFLPVLFVSRQFSI